MEKLSKITPYGQATSNSRQTRPRDIPNKGTWRSNHYVKKSSEGLTFEVLDTRINETCSKF